MIASKLTKLRTHGLVHKMQHRKQSQGLLYRQKRERGGEGETAMKYSGNKINLQVRMVNWKMVEGKN